MREKRYDKRRKVKDSEVKKGVRYKAKGDEKIMMKGGIKERRRESLRRTR